MTYTYETVGRVGHMERAGKKDKQGEHVTEEVTVMVTDSGTGLSLKCTAPTEEEAIEAGKEALTSAIVDYHRQLKEAEERARAQAEGTPGA